MGTHEKPPDRPHAARRVSCPSCGRLLRSSLHRADSTDQVAPGEIGLDPLVSLRAGFDPIELADINDLGLAFGLADGVEPVSLPGRFEADAIDDFSVESGPERADDFRADRADQAGMLV